MCANQGKFYELFEMDAHVGAEVLGLMYMRVRPRHVSSRDMEKVFLRSCKSACCPHADAVFSGTLKCCQSFVPRTLTCTLPACKDTAAIVVHDSS